MDSESNQDICDWKIKYNEQCKYIDKVITQFMSMKLNEKKLTAKLREWERYKEFIQSELSNYYETIVIEQNEIIEKLNSDLNSKEEELHNTHKKLKYVCDRLRFEFQCQKTKFLNPNSQNNEQIDKNLNFEHEVLPIKFKIVCDKLRKTKAAYDEAQNMIKNHIISIKNSVETIEKLTQGEENNLYKVLALKVQKLKEKNRIKDEELCIMSKKVKELERRNEYNELKINKLKNKLLKSNLIIENIQRSETNHCETNQQFYN